MDNNTKHIAREREGLPKQHYLDDATMND